MTSPVTYVSSRAQVFAFIWSSHDTDLLSRMHFLALRGQVVSNRDIVMATPVLDRNVMNRATLVAGVTNDNMDGAAYTSNAQASISISGGGGQRGGNEILIDGIPNTVARSGGIALFVPSLDSVQEIKAGAPLSVTQTNGRPGIPGEHGRTCPRPECCRAAADPICKSPANIGRFGNSGVNVLRGPSTKNVDLSAMKTFQITEGKKLLFRVMMTNAFNHPNFSNPAANISAPGTVGRISTTFNEQLGEDQRWIHFSLRFQF